MITRSCKIFCAFLEVCCHLAVNIYRDFLSHSSPFTTFASHSGRLIVSVLESSNISGNNRHHKDTYTQIHVYFRTHGSVGLCLNSTYIRQSYNPKEQFKEFLTTCLIFVQKFRHQIFYIFNHPHVFIFILFYKLNVLPSVSVRFKR